MRKLYVEGHTSGDSVRIAAEASEYASQTPDTRVELYDGLAIIMSGDVPAEEIAACAARAAELGGGEVFQGRRAA